MDLCNIPILPLSADAKAPFSSAFNHQKETASPAYYEVFLEDYAINVRLTSTLRAGIHENTFEKDDKKRIIFDIGRANNNVSNWDISLTDENEVQGFQRVGDDKVHFSAKLSSEIKDIEIIKRGERGGYAIVELVDGQNDPVILKTGISYVSIENAAQNLQEEIGNASF